MIHVFRITSRFILIAVTISTWISVYCSRKNRKEPEAVDFSENLKEALLTTEIAFKVLTIMVPFLCIGCLLLFFVTHLRIEALMLFAACIQIPIIFSALQKIHPDLKGGE